MSSEGINFETGNRTKGKKRLRPVRGGAEYEQSAPFGTPGTTFDEVAGRGGLDRSQLSHTPWPKGEAIGHIYVCCVLVAIIIVVVIGVLILLAFLVANVVAVVLGAVIRVIVVVVVLVVIVDVVVAAVVVAAAAGVVAIVACHRRRRHV